MNSRLLHVSSAARQVLIVTNPSAGARHRAEMIHELIGALEARGFKVEIVTELSALDRLVPRYQADGQLRAIVAAGGDGTVAEIVNRTAAEVPVTVYPLGTANLLARYFQIPRDASAFAEMVEQGVCVRIDAARANGRVFTLMAGCGFDAEVVQRLHRQRSGANITTWSYAGPIWQAVRSYGYPTLRIHCRVDPIDGDQPAGPAGDAEPAWQAPILARWAFVVNLPRYAGGLKIAPHAVGTDGLLDVCTFSKGSLWNGLRYLSHVKWGLPLFPADCATTGATRVRIESDQEAWYQLDGDPGGRLPLAIESLPARITFVVPRAKARDVLTTDRAARVAEPSHAR